MLASQPQHHHLYATLHLQHHRRRPPPSATLATTSKRPFFSPIFSSLRHHNHQSTSPDQENEAASTGESDILRTHNARATAVLLRHLSNQDQENPDGENQEAFLPLLKEDREKLLEISLLSKRTPQFPGSIYINSSLPLVQSVFKTEKSNLNYSDDDVDDEMLVKALEIRRKVTAAVFKEAMKKDRFAITYCENLISEIPDFIDYVMIKAVSMKKFPEFLQSSYNIRAKFFIDECEVVPLIRWLKHNSLSYRQIGKLVCASKGKLDSIRQLAEWLKTIHVKGRYIGVTLTRAGGDVLERSIEEFEEIVEYLEDNGVRKDWMGYVVSRCPELLSFTMDELRSRTEFYLSMGMEKNDFGTMLFDCPKVIGHFSFEEMNQKVIFLLTKAGVSQRDIGKVVALAPGLLGCRIANKLDHNVKYFLSLGIRLTVLGEMISDFPMLLRYNVDVLRPKYHYLRRTMIRPLKDLIEFPRFFSYSLEERIIPRHKRMVENRINFKRGAQMKHST